MTRSTSKQKRAVTNRLWLDISKSNPPGQDPFAWDNRMGSVKRWYDYSASADKLGTIYFEAVTSTNNMAPLTVKCTTEIAYRVLGESEAWHVRVEDPSEHQRLMEFFLCDFLTTPPNHIEGLQTK